MRNVRQSSHPVLSYADGIASAWQDFIILCGRILLGWIFIQAGWPKLMNIPGFASGMASRGVPEFLGYIAPPLEVIGGVMILLGLGTRYAALMILAFTIAATYISHRWWTYPEAQQANQATNFWKNVSMIGGQMLLFVTGGGRFSLDTILRRRS
jgi:putative oxidoreductase